MCRIKCTRLHFSGSGLNIIVGDFALLHFDLYFRVRFRSTRLVVFFTEDIIEPNLSVSCTMGVIHTLNKQYNKTINHFLRSINYKSKLPSKSTVCFLCFFILFYKIKSRLQNAQSQ